MFKEKSIQGKTGTFSKKILLACVLLILYFLRLYQVHQFFEPLTQTRTYEIGESFSEYDILYTVNSARMTTLKELTDTYGMPDFDISFFNDEEYYYYMVTLTMTNTGQENAVSLVSEITLQSEYWRTQMMHEFVWSINGYDASMKQSLSAGETRTFTYVYPVSVISGYEKYIENDWYLCFRLSPVKQKVLVRKWTANS